MCKNHENMKEKGKNQGKQQHEHYRYVKVNLR